MKKFLSLLLALTLVLSLVVVPARADAPDPTAISVGSTATVTRGSNATITATAPTSAVNNSGETKTYSELTTAGYAKGTETWSWSAADSKVTLSGQATNAVTVTGVTAGNATLTCNYAVTFTKEANTENNTPADTIKVNKSATVTVTVNDAAFAKDISHIVFNGRNYPVTNGQTATVYYVAGELTNNATWSVLASGSYTASIKEGFTKPTSGSSVTVPVTVKSSTNDSITTDTNVTVTLSEVSAPTVSASPLNVVNGQTLTYTASGNANASSSYVGYDWSVTLDGNPVSVTVIEQKNNTWKIKAPAANASGKNYVVNCVVKEGSASSVAGTTTLTVTQDKYSPAYNATTPDSSKILVYGSSNQKEWTIPTPYLKGNGVTDVKSGYTLAYKSSNTSVAPVDSSNGKVTAGSTAGQATITATITYQGKDYELLYTIYNRAPSYTIPTSIQAGTVTPYDTATLKLYASYALSSAGINIPVTSITTISGVAAKSNCTVTQPAYGSTTYYVTSGTFGTATFTGTVSTRANGTYPITFSVAVKPQTTTYEDQYPEPVASGNTYRYYVQVPSGFASYYVVGTPNQTTEPNWALTGTQYYGNNLYYLTDSNFVGGKCTLWLVTRTSGGAYYCGLLTVYQKNYNINYNGVAGETVQFAQSDFNDFMNKVAEARGDASKTKSYPYVTFDYVTFSLPTTAQGTLYYGGTAMSTSNSSGAFNTRTKVTNLDSVTFVPNAKSTAKTITLNFTLYATRYSSSSTSRGTTVSYSGSVVVNLVREDIKYTVSQGDSVRFDESDFLSYLRSTKGYSSNYTIDYVTFDQSAVSAVNEGSLYTYYSGYNYGGSVKTTDKFYYSATASQNALSDVAFLASRYAKTGETVYIPFTIYARYGTTGTGTRQLTGTVAIKIGQTMNFIDVKTTDYFYNSVKWAVGKNITNGTSSTTFSPYKSCTRAEIVTFLWRAAGSPEPTTTRNPFRDVNAVTHSSYYKAILWASQKGITSGTSTTAFSPDQVCTRAQIVTFLYRYAGQPSGYYSNPFKDVGATSEASYYNAIRWAVGKGITSGTSATTFSPYASCNRAEAVTFLYRYTNGL